MNTEGKIGLFYPSSFVIQHSLFDIFFFIFRFVLLLSFLLALAGCQPKIASVSGKVTWKGKPLPKEILDGRSPYRVVFFSLKNSFPQTCPLGRDGGYSIAEILAGPVEVTVEPVPPPADPKGGNERRMPNLIDMEVGQLTTKEKPPLPERFRYRNKSGLNFFLQPGPQQLDIDLK